MGSTDAIPTPITIEEQIMILRFHTNQFFGSNKSNKLDGFVTFTEFRRLPSLFQNNCIEYSLQKILYNMQ